MTLEMPKPRTALTSEQIEDRIEEHQSMNCYDKNGLTAGIGVLQKVQDFAAQAAEPHDPQPDNPQHLSLKQIGTDLPEGFTYELLWDGKPVAPPEETPGVMASIMQDLGVIPEDYLVPAGPGAYSKESPTVKLDPNDVWKGTYHEEGALLYKGWDFTRRHYRKNWCVLRERDVHPQYSNFISATLTKHSGLLKSLRRTFEALRGQDKLLKKQAHGAGVDIYRRLTT